MNSSLRFAILLLGLAIAPACQKKPAGKSPETGPPATEDEDDETAPQPVERADVEPPAEPKTATCRDDRDCSGYLRCESGECAVPPAVDGRVVEGMPEVVFRKKDDEIARFKVELAVQPWERSRGLMHRRKMHPEFGMLFVFDDERVRSFWMKNTIIPLDMVHLDASGDVVGVVHSAEPMTLTARRTDEPARYVLELNAGTAKKLGIEPGVEMRLENAPQELKPR